MALLEIQGVYKQFGGLKALAGVGLEVEQGRAHAVIGPNGAGKSTLFNCINCIYRADRGTIRFKGKDITGLAPHKMPRIGIARTFQNVELFRNATVLNNILLGRYLHKRTNLVSEALFLPSVKKQELEARRKVEEIMDLLDLQAYRERMVAQLPFGIQKSVELARALALEPELLLLDEPSSGLNPEEKQDLCFWIEDIKEELGITILLVEHDMRVVTEVAERTTALDFGSVIADGTTEEVQRHPDVIRAFLGEED
ncbi:MAG: ABC transporter ATP-binding protein [Thermodesulfobacteriota bacterium]